MIHSQLLTNHFEECLPVVHEQNKATTINQHSSVPNILLKGYPPNPKPLKELYARALLTVVRSCVEWPLCGDSMCRAGVVTLQHS